MCCFGVGVGVGVVYVCVCMHAHHHCSFVHPTHTHAHTHIYMTKQVRKGKGQEPHLDVALRLGDDALVLPLELGEEERCGLVHPVAAGVEAVCGGRGVWGCGV